MATHTVGTQFEPAGGYLAYCASCAWREVHRSRRDASDAALCHAYTAVMEVARG